MGIVNSLCLYNHDNIAEEKSHDVVMSLLGK